MTDQTETDVLPLPPGMRELLLAALDLGYPEGAAQRQLRDAPDGAVAWQVGSMLDDYADYRQLPGAHPAQQTDHTRGLMDDIMKGIFGVERRT